MRCQYSEKYEILVREDSVFFKEPVTGSLTMLQWTMSIWATHIGFFVIFSLGKKHDGRKMDLGGMENECHWSALWEILK